MLIFLEGVPFDNGTIKIIKLLSMIYADRIYQKFCPNFLNFLCKSEGILSWNGPRGGGVLFEQIVLLAENKLLDDFGIGGKWPIILFKMQMSDLWK